MQRNPNAISNSESIACLQELASYTVEVKCKSELHRFLIGRGGANIKAVSLAFPYLVAFAFFKFRRTRTNRQSIKPFFQRIFVSNIWPRGSNIFVASSFRGTVDEIVF